MGAGRFAAMVARWTLPVFAGKQADGRSHHLYRVNVANGDRQALANLDSDIDVVQMQISPAGDKLLLVATALYGDHVYAVATDGTSLRKSVDSPEAGEFPRTSSLHRSSSSGRGNHGDRSLYAAWSPEGSEVKVLVERGVDHSIVTGHGRILTHQGHQRENHQRTKYRWLPSPKSKTGDDPDGHVGCNRPGTCVGATARCESGRLRR